MNASQGSRAGVRWVILAEESKKRSGQYTTAKDRGGGGETGERRIKGEELCSKLKKRLSAVGWSVLCCCSQSHSSVVLAVSGHTGVCQHSDDGDIWWSEAIRASVACSLLRNWDTSLTSLVWKRVHVCVSETVRYLYPWMSPLQGHTHKKRKHLIKTQSTWCFRFCEIKIFNLQQQSLATEWVLNQTLEAQWETRATGDERHQRGKSRGRLRGEES